jgi:predicted MPP superfamily phosphohydrolase
MTMPASLAGDLVTAGLVRIPGNQALQLHVHRKSVEVPRLSGDLDGLSIAHLSDLHFTGQMKKEFYQRVVARANEFDADLVALTGDLVDKSRCIEWIPDTLGRLRARFGVFFVLGNHDLRVRDLQRLRESLTDSGLTDLSGRWLRRSVRGEPVVLAGNEMPWIPPITDLTDCPVESDGKRNLRIALCHDPDQIGWAQAWDIDVMLAGHTHGGQICPPFVGPVVTPSRRGLSRIAGAYREGPTLLHISRGLAGTRPLRINCPPELTMLVLKSPREHARHDTT